MEDNLQAESADHERNERAVEEPDPVNERRLVPARFVVREPGPREVLRGVSVTLAARLDEVRGENRRVGIVGRGDVVDAVTVDAERGHAGLVELVALAGSAERGADPMEVGEISLE